MAKENSFFSLYRSTDLNVHIISQQIKLQAEIEMQLHNVKEHNEIVTKRVVIKRLLHIT